MTARKYGNEYRSTLICVDSYENAVLKGRYYSQFRENGVQFQSAIEMLLSMEEMLEQMQFPQAFSRARTFANGGAAVNEAPNEERIQTGKLATFQVRVLFRQNCSWQGTVHWLDGRKEESFRSVLELILLMDTALSLEKAS